MPAGFDPQRSIVGPFRSEDKANTRSEKSAATSADQASSRFAARVVNNSSKWRGPAEAQPGNCHEIREDQTYLCSPVRNFIFNGVSEMGETPDN